MAGAGSRQGEWSLPANVLRQFWSCPLAASLESKRQCQLHGPSAFAYGASTPSEALMVLPGKAAPALMALMAVGVLKGLQT